MEVDGVAEPLPTAKAAGGVFDPLDLGVDAFAAGIGDAQDDGVDDPIEVVLDHLGHRSDRLKPGADCPAVPL